ncbi:hypothetical protein NUACC21_17910 [Scytonema sp. NUACC21]
MFFSDIVVLACGAVNSAALLLLSANSLHPTGLANSSAVSPALTIIANALQVGDRLIERLG